MEVPSDSAWLWEAIRLSIRPTDSVAAVDEKGPPEQRDPRFRKLIEGVLWSKRFILTYHLLIVCIIGLFATVHWSGRYRRWRSRQSIVQYREEPASSGGSSSGSSTIQGDASPLQKTIGEDTPLLHDGHELRPLYPQRTIYTRAKALMMYQPSPIPIVHKVLPENAKSVAILIFIAIQVFYTVFHINFTVFELFVFADRCGLVFAANLPLLYLMAAKTQPLRVLTGISYESLNIWHRRLGEVLCLEALLHGLGMVGVWYTIFRPLHWSLLRFMLETVCLLGLSALVCYETLYLTSLGSFRQRWYELFLCSHVFLQAAALPILWFHHAGSRPYVGIALGIFLLDRIVYRLGIKSQYFEARGEVLEDGKTVRIGTDVEVRPTGILSSMFGRNVTRGWEATDHVFLSVSGMSRKHAFQAHPFTIASAAPRTGTTTAGLELLIRAQEGFSSDLLRELQTRKDLRIRLDGPYGSSHARHLLEDSEVVILMAGGSGIAVGWPLVQHLLRYGAGDTEQATRHRRQKIYLVWVIHKASHLSWIGRRNLQEAEQSGVETIIPQATEEVGRPDLESVIDEIVEKSNAGSKIGIVVSGPNSMTRATRNVTARLVRDGRKAKIAVEKFGW